MVLPGDRRRSGPGRIASASRLAREARWKQESAAAAAPEAEPTAEPSDAELTAPAAPVADGDGGPPTS